MRKIKEVLRLKWEKGLSDHQIADSCDISRSTVKDYLNDVAVEHLLFPPVDRKDTNKRHMPPMDYIHRELKRKRVTLQLLWNKYKKTNPDGYQYSQFC